MVRKWLLALLGVGMLSSVGCLNRYSSDPNTFTAQLLNESEDLRQIEYEMRRFWMNDHPSNLTPDRINGAIQ